MADGLHSDTTVVEGDKQFVLSKITELEGAGLGIVHRSSDNFQRLYLISGEVYRLGESEITRLS
jgi:hypothetical protein